MTSWDFPGSDPVDIDINIAAGSVTVAARDTGTTTVRLEPIEPGRRDEQLLAGVQVTFEQGRLEIAQPRSGLVRGHESLRLTVTAPAHSSAAVRTASASIHCEGDLNVVSARAASGDVTVASASGSLEATTASGDVLVENAGGSATLRTASGDIRVQHAGSEISAETASGDILITTAATSARAHTASGDVRIASLTAGQADVKTVSGDARIGVAAGTGVYLDLSSLTGDIQSHLEETAGDQDVSLRVSCRSVSGDIRVDRAAVTAAP